MRRAGGGVKSRLAIEDDLAGGDVSPVAVVFGANASGKSTVLDALERVKWLVRYSAQFDPSLPLVTDPFLLDDLSRSSPFACAVSFTTTGREFHYSFSIQAGLVQTEELKETVQGPARRATRVLFTRQADGESRITVAPTLQGPKKNIIAATRPNTLFLSKAAQENFRPLLDVYEWFVDPGTQDDPWVGRSWMSDPTADLYKTDAAFRPWLVNLLAQADLGVTDVSLVPAFTKPSRVSFQIRSTDGSDDQDQPAQKNHRDAWLPELQHRSVPGAPTAIPWLNESRGTQALWHLASDIYLALRSGRPLLIDELSDLHPLVVREVLRTFQSREKNPENAQLIFTSNDATLLGSWGGDGYMLDRDQIWFTEKDFASGKTSLVPLTDFDPRRDEDTEKWYLQGRYGAVPSVGNLIDPYLGTDSG